MNHSVKQKPIPQAVLEKACSLVSQQYGTPLPFPLRGITVDREKIRAAMEILNSHPQRTMPQNCRNDIRARTPDGLDRRLKEALNTDLRMANIISDVLASAQIAEIVRVENPATGRMVKGTRLKGIWCWSKATGNDLPPLPAPDKPKKRTVGKHKVHWVVIAEDKRNYLQSPYVQGFIRWLEPCLDQDNLNHEFYIKRPGIYWSCTSLHSAFESYNWPFRYTCPTSKQERKGYSFTETFQFLSRMSERLRQSVREDNTKLCRDCCTAILAWGGVKAKNEKRILSMGESLCQYLKTVQEKLDLESEKIQLNGEFIITSGFVKIYALLVDNFIMYDGRVGAALGLLARRYCEEERLESIPQELLFSFGRGREAEASSIESNRRNPSRGNYRFPEMTGNPEQHLKDSIRASWLLKRILENTNSRFNTLPQNGPLDMRLWALQSALFMIGYDVKYTST